VTKADGSDITITLEVTDATGLTGTPPNADTVFDVDFTLTVSQDLAIDLGTEADALKLLAYTGNIEDKTSPMIPVDTTLDFGFTMAHGRSRALAAGALCSQGWPLLAGVRPLVGRFIGVAGSAEATGSCRVKSATVFRPHPASGLTLLSSLDT
jgi:hypothetical protein